MYCASIFNHSFVLLIILANIILFYTVFNGQVSDVIYFWLQDCLDFGIFLGFEN